MNANWLILIFQTIIFFNHMYYITNDAYLYFTIKLKENLKIE